MKGCWCYSNERKIMTKAIPDGFHTITPHLIVSDAAKAIDFYKKAFGAQETDRFMAPESESLVFFIRFSAALRLTASNERPTISD